MAKSKREEIAEEKEDGYEFELPDFDEKAFVRREVLGARATFVAVGLGLVAGLVAAAIWRWSSLPWQVGLLVLLVGTLAFRPTLQRLDYPEDVTSWRATFGSHFTLFFTGLAVWILAINVV